jgi:RND family efflux transporter MFP subunit
MFQKYILPLVALAGVVFAIFTVFWGDKTRSPVPPVSKAPQSPYRSFVAGSGLVEASTENIAIGTQIDGIVSKIFVQIGSDAKAGDPLFKIDDRSLLAQLNVHKATVQVAEAQLAEAQYDLAHAESLLVDRITSIEDRDIKRFAAQKAQAQLSQAKEELESIETDLERLTVRAPVDGQVLQLKIHLGEFAQGASAFTGQPPLILLGSVKPLNVRVDVDENDAWRVRAGASAFGCLRGNMNINTPLKFVRFEPFVVPKKSLTGDSAERVDTRVLQVIFSFERGEQPVFVGQQMDVFIDTKESAQNKSTTATKRGP